MFPDLDLDSDQLSAKEPCAPAIHMALLRRRIQATKVVALK